MYRSIQLRTLPSTAAATIFTSSSTLTRSSSHRSMRLLCFVVAVLMAWLSVAQANIQCASPNGTNVYKAGDPIILDWTSDGSSPAVSDIVSMTATLSCDSGVSIANITITSWATAFTWTVPSVGNATTAGGTMGTCTGNSFHITYNGVATETVVFFPVQKPFTVPCKSMTILPAPNVTAITTTLAPTSTVATSTSSRATKTTSTSENVSPTSTSTATPAPEESKPKTFIIVIVAIVAGLILFLVAFGTWFYLRKQRIQRMQNAIMPWSNDPSNQFAKVSSMDEGHRSPGSLNGRTPGISAAHAGAGVAAVATKLGSNKSQPELPQPSHGYYQDDGHSYGQQRPGGGYGGNQQGHNGYDGYNANAEDDYYNPYYAQGGGPGYAASPAGSKATYYSGNRTPYQDPRDPYQQSPQQPGYFPPPPPVTSNAHGMSPTSGVIPPPSVSTSGLNTITSPTLTTSPGRAPQIILPEKGRPSDDKGAQDIQMKVLVSSP